jgi:hypothetical protein
MTRPVCGKDNPSSAMDNSTRAAGLTLRPAGLEDAGKWLAFLLTLDTETDFMLFEVGERDQSVEKCRQAIGRILDVPGAKLLFLEDAAGDIVGYFKGDVMPVERKAHVMGLSCAILRQYQGDAGSRSLREFIAAVRSEGIIRRVEASIMASNVRMLGLSLHMGAVIEGLRRQSIRMRDGYVDEYILALLV